MRELHTIEVDRWEPSERKGLVKHVGMIGAQEAFDALEKHLTENALLPDEYFQANKWDWKEGQELPNFYKASCDVSWGGSEGIYLDIALLYRDKNQQLQRFNFATGKTLGESGDDFLRMSRIAAECSMMLNGRGSIIRVSENERENIQLTEYEKDLVIKALDFYGDKVADSVGYSDGEKYWDLKGKFESLSFVQDEDNVVKPALDKVIQEAQNSQQVTLKEVAEFLSAVQSDAIGDFKKKYGIEPGEILANGQLLAQVASEKQRLGASVETALHNVCLSLQEKKHADRLAELRKMKQER